jgi:hypothetical protein
MTSERLIRRLGRISPGTLTAVLSVLQEMFAPYSGQRRAIVTIARNCAVRNPLTQPLYDVVALHP